MLDEGRVHVLLLTGPRPRDGKGDVEDVGGDLVIRLDAENVDVVIIIIIITIYIDSSTGYSIILPDIVLPEHMDVVARRRHHGRDRVHKEGEERGQKGVLCHVVEPQRH